MPGPPQPPEKPGREPRRLKLDTVLALMLVILAVVFVFENTTRVAIRFIGPRIRVQVWIALLVALLAGMVVGWLLRRWRERSR